MKFLSNKKTKLRTSINVSEIRNTNIPSRPRKKSQRRDDTFISSKNTNKNSKFNSESIVSLGSGIKSLAMVTDVAGKNFRDSVKNVRNQILNVSTTKNDQSSIQNKDINYNESDIERFQKNVSDKISDNINVSSFSDSSKNVVNSLIEDLKSIGALQSFKNKNDSSHSPNVNRPIIHDYELKINASKGLIDSFVSKISFMINAKSIESGKLRAFRIFRSKVNDKKLYKDFGRLSFFALDALKSNNNNRTHIKNENSTSAYELKLRENNIRNSLTDLLPNDSITGLRGSSEKESIIASSSIINRNDIYTNSSDTKSSLLLSSFIKTEGIIDIDLSVAQDVNTIRNIKLQDQNSSISVLSGRSITVGNNVVNKDSIDRLSITQIKNIKEQLIDSIGPIVAKQNEDEYSEIAILSVDKLRGIKIGDFIRYEFEDASVFLGNSYRYYIVSIDNNIIDSLRSEIVQIDVEKVIPPNSPKNIYANVIDNNVSITIFDDQEFIEKFEIYRKIINNNSINDEKIKILSINGSSGYSVEEEKRSQLKNGFTQIGESLRSHNGSSTFIDRTVIPGISYQYRIFSVDIFNNKSQDQKEINVFVPEKSFKLNNLVAPTIIAEHDSKTEDVKLTIFANDKRILRLFLGRKDHTINERSFTDPNNSSQLIFGLSKDAKRGNYFEGLISREDISGDAWLPSFENTESGIIEFTDKLTNYDHIYQYSVYGIDRFGNISSYGISNPIFISRRAVINTPVNLRSNIEFDDNSNVKGVTIQWDDGNININPEDRIGNRSNLENNSVKSLYQLERKRLDRDIWEQFPLTEDTKFFDSISKLDGVKIINQKYRPDFVEQNQTYYYRVAALQSGSFFSNFTLPIEVVVSKKVLKPINFVIKTPSIKNKPFFVVLNWDTDVMSSDVDHWEIERAVINNLASTKLNFKNISDFNKKLNFEFLTRISRESSRGKSRVLDEINNSGVQLNDFSRKTSVFIGQHHYIDSDVIFGNTYYYRIRAIDVASKNKSIWNNRGIKLVSPVFSNIIDSSLTRDEKDEISNNDLPVRLGNNFPTEILSNLSSKVRK